jgi:L-ribulose-5-phosphate 4-epimerase
VNEPRRNAREQAYRANIHLAASGLVMGTFGNVSVVDRAAGVLFIKPSGVAYEELTAEHIAAVALDTGAVVGGRFRPSSDTPTHIEIYRAFQTCGAVVHTHSEYATVLAQARTPVRCMGTTHADCFRGDIPVTRPMREEEIEQDYERNTGLLIVETFHAGGISPDEIPAVLVANHGPFAWGADAAHALEHARTLEYVARLEWRLRAMGADAERPAQCLVDKHYRRKHGSSAYYGQP